MSRYYVVWQGRIPGIYDNWEECKAQTNRFSGSKYKAFDSLTEAELAYASSWQDFYIKKAKEPKKSPAPGLFDMPPPRSDPSPPWDDYQPKREKYVKRGPFPKWGDK